MSNQMPFICASDVLWTRGIGTVQMCFH